MRGSSAQWDNDSLKPDIWTCKPSVTARKLGCYGCMHIKWITSQLPCKVCRNNIKLGDT